MLLLQQHVLACAGWLSPSSSLARAKVPSLRASWRCWRDHAPRRGCRVRRSGAARGDDSGPGDGEKLDIDALAARLSAEAEKMRLSGASLDINAEEEEEEAAEGELQQGPGAAGAGAAAKESLLQPLGFQSTAREEEMLAEVGEGGFFASEFELQEQLGQINIQQVERSVDPQDLLPASERKSRAAVIAYVAKYYSGLPFQEPVFVMLKEYLPGAKAVACNELQVLKYLTGLPEVGRKWSRARSALTPEPPIAQLLGYFVAGLSEQAGEVLEGSAAAAAAPAGSASSAGGEAAGSAGFLQEQAPGAGASTVWVVMKWEGLTPVALYPSAPQPRSGFSMLWGRNDSPFRYRIQMLRSICRGSLSALAYCHSRGVVHGSLGSGSVLLSTFTDAEAEQLVVKLDNFGFAQRILPPGAAGSGNEGAVLVPPPLLADDTPLALGQKADLRALAIVLLECLLSALAEGGPSQLTAAESIERLLGEVFQWDVAEFRQYCADEPSLATAVAFLDDEGGAGWGLMEALIQGTYPAEQLKACSFCQL